MKINGKKLIALMLCLTAMFALCACFSKTAINKADFEAKAKELGLTVAEFTEVNQPTADMLGIMEYSLVGETNESGFVWMAQFSQYDSVNSAKFDFSRSKLEIEPTGISSITSTTLINAETYEMNSSDQYVYVAQVDDTLLIVSADSAHKDAAKAFIKAIGY